MGGPGIKNASPECKRTATRKFFWIVCFSAPVPSRWPQKRKLVCLTRYKLGKPFFYFIPDMLGLQTAAAASRFSKESVPHSCPQGLAASLQETLNWHVKFRGSIPGYSPSGPD